MGLDIGREHDKTVFVVFEQLDEKSPAYVRFVRVMDRRPFPEQQAMGRQIVAQFNADITVVDNTGMGKETGERLQFTLPCTVVRFDFTEQTKSELLGVAYAYFTSGMVRCHPKHRQLLKEFENIKRKKTPAGNVVFKDEPHGDWAWAGSLALYGLKRMVGDVGVRDASGIFEGYAERRMFDRTPPGVDPPRASPVQRGRMTGMTVDGQPYVIKVPNLRCPYGDQRTFTDQRWLDLHVRNDHPEEWMKSQQEPKEEDA